MQEEKKLASAEELKGKKSGRSGQKRKNTFLLRGVIVLMALALAGGIYYFSGKVQPAPAEEPAATAVPDERVKLIERSREEVAEVSVERDGSVYTVVQGKSGEASAARHSLKERADFDLDQAKAEAILACAANLTATRRVAEQAEDLAAYGLEPPRARVCMRYTDGSETVCLIGDQAPTSTAYYFMREGDSAVYLLYASAAESLSAARNAMHTLSMPGTLDSGSIRDLVIERAGQETVEIGYSQEGEADKSYSVSALRVRQPFYYTANAERALELFSNVAALKIVSFAGAIDELRDTGLEEGNSRFRLTVSQRAASEEEENTETFVFRIGNRTEDGRSVYWTVDDTTAVYLTDASSVNFLEDATPAYLVDQFSNLIRIGAVRAVELRAGEEQWVLEIEHAADEKSQDVYRFNGEAVQDTSAFRKLYQQIIGLTSSKLSEDYSLEGEPLLSVRYTLETDPGELQIDYLAYDADYCAVRRDGLTLFLLKKVQLDNLLSALRAF